MYILQLLAFESCNSQAAVSPAYEQAVEPTSRKLRPSWYAQRDARMTKTAFAQH